MALTERMADATPFHVTAAPVADSGGSLSDLVEPPRQERRAAPRFGIALPVRIRAADSDSPTQQCVTRNVSVGGMFVADGELPRALGAMLQIKRIGDVPMHVVAEVAHFRHVEPDTDGTSGWGLRVLNPEENRYARLMQKLIDLHESGGLD